jgi:hypothetical protein
MRPFMAQEFLNPRFDYDPEAALPEEIVPYLEQAVAVARQHRETIGLRDRLDPEVQYQLAFFRAHLAGAVERREDATGESVDSFDELFRAARDVEEPKELPKHRTPKRNGKFKQFENGGTFRVK